MEFGVKQLLADQRYIAANVSLIGDKLAPRQSFAEYLKVQTNLMSGHFKQLTLAGPNSWAFPGAEEAVLLLARHRVRNSVDMLHVQNYVRVGLWIGVVTLTVPEVSLATVRPDFDSFVKGLCILPEQPDRTT